MKKLLNSNSFIDICEQTGRGVVTPAKFYYLVKCNKCKCVSCVPSNEIRQSVAICPCCKHKQSVANESSDYIHHQMATRYSLEKKRIDNVLKGSITKTIKKNKDDIWISRNLIRFGNCYVNRPITIEFIYHLKQLCKFDITVRPTMFVESGYILERVK